MMNVNITIHLDVSQRHGLCNALEFLAQVAALFPPPDELKAKALVAAIEGNREKVETMRETLAAVDPA